MSIKSVLVSTSLLLTLACVAPAQDEQPSISLPASLTGAAPAAPDAPAEPRTQPTEAELLEIYGWMSGMRAGLSRLGLTEEQLTSFVRGLVAAANGAEVNFDMEQIGPQVSQFVQAKFEANLAAISQAEEARAAPFWTEIKAKAGVVMLPSGVGYEITKPSEGAKPTATDNVKVHYTGRLFDGTVFDSSEGGEPAIIALDQVIPGWTEGMQNVGVGGSIRLYIPPAMGYGEMGGGAIPPGASLVFDVELLEINPALPEPTAPVAPVAPAGS